MPEEEVIMTGNNGYYIGERFSIPGATSPGIHGTFGMIGRSDPANNPDFDHWAIGYNSHLGIFDHTLIKAQGSAWDFARLANFLMLYGVESQVVSHKMYIPKCNNLRWLAGVMSYAARTQDRSKLWLDDPCRDLEAIAQMLLKMEWMEEMPYMIPRRNKVVYVMPVITESDRIEARNSSRLEENRPALVQTTPVDLEQNPIYDGGFEEEDEVVGNLQPSIRPKICLAPGIMSSAGLEYCIILMQGVLYRDVASIEDALTRRALPDLVY
jgi:hypothetical protein